MMCYNRFNKLGWKVLISPIETINLGGKMMWLVLGGIAIIATFFNLYQCGLPPHC